MDTEISPTLKPLIHELKGLSVGYYLASADFERACNRYKIEAAWDSVLKRVENNRKYVLLGDDHKPFDSQDALIIFLNSLFKDNNRDIFDKLIYIVLYGFISWSKKEEINLTNILKDLSELQMNKDLLSKLENYYSKYKSQFKITRKSNIELEKVEILEAAPKFEEKKKNWLKFISKAQIEKVVDELIDLGVEDSSNMLVGLSSRWHTLQNDYHKGVLKREEYEIENNKIVHALSNFVKNLENTEG